MKRIAFTFLAVLLIFNSLSLLGVAFMDHSIHEQCPFAVMSNKNCETVADARGTLFHHIEAYQSLSQTLVSFGVSVLASVLLAAVLFTIRHIVAPDLHTEKIVQRFIFQEYVVEQIYNPILRWIALHNKRSTHLLSLRVVA